MKGQTVSLSESLDAFERILKDEFKDYPENALYMIGTDDQAKGKSTGKISQSYVLPDSSRKAQNAS